MAEYWYSRWLFERALAALYLVAFIAAAKQFVPLLGEHGLEPVGRWVQSVPFRASPSLFYLYPKDTVFTACAWLGIALSVFALFRHYGRDAQQCDACADDYLYKFTTPEERRTSGRWWTRQLVGTFYGPVSLSRQ